MSAVVETDLSLGFTIAGTSRGCASRWSEIEGVGVAVGVGCGDPKGVGDGDGVGDGVAKCAPGFGIVVGAGTLT